MARVINLVVVQDGNPDVLDAIDYLESMIEEGKVLSYSTSASMGEDNFNVEVPEQYEQEVKAGLIALKYGIV